MNPSIVFKTFQFCEESDSKETTLAHSHHTHTSPRSLSADVSRTSAHSPANAASIIAAPLQRHLPHLLSLTTNAKTNSSNNNSAGAQKMKNDVSSPSARRFDSSVANPMQLAK